MQAGSGPCCLVPGAARRRRGRDHARDRTTSCSTRRSPPRAGKVEVLEFFWYACPHCNSLAAPARGLAQAQAGGRRVPARARGARQTRGCRSRAPITRSTRWGSSTSCTASSSTRSTSSGRSIPGRSPGPEAALRLGRRQGRGPPEVRGHLQLLRGDAAARSARPICRATTTCRTRRCWWWTATTSRRRR